MIYLKQKHEIKVEWQEEKEEKSFRYYQTLILKFEVNENELEVEGIQKYVADITFAINLAYPRLI